MKALKVVLDHSLVLEKVNIVIEFNQKLWSKPSLDMNIKLRTKDKKIFEKDVTADEQFNVWKRYKNEISHRDMRLATTNKRRNTFSPNSNYRTRKHFL